MSENVNIENCELVVGLHHIDNAMQKYYSKLN